MPYDPYKVNDIMSQNTGLMLGAANRDLRRRELDMEESLMPSKLTMMKEQAKSSQLGSMQRVLGLTYQYESRGIPKEKYWPALQQVMPELKDISVDDINPTNGGTGMSFYNKQTGATVDWVTNPNTGELEMVKSNDPSVDPSSMYISKQMEEAKTPQEREKYKNILDTARTPRMVTDTKTGKRYQITQTGDLIDLHIENKPEIPGGEVSKTAELKNLKSLGFEAAKLFDPSYTGAIKGLANNVYEKWTDMLPEEQIEFKTVTSQLYNTMGHIRYGGAFTENEIKRLEAEMPTDRMPPKTYAVRLKRFIKMMDIDINSREKEFKAKGYNMGETETPKAELETKTKGGDYPLAELPDPTQYQGKKAEGDNGEMYISDGVKWNRIK